MNDNKTDVRISTDVTQAVNVIKSAILQSQSRAVRMISGTQLSLYFGIGLYVSANSRKGTWGTGAIKFISEQLRRELPGLRGFSEESIKKMRTFSEFWSQYLNRSPMATEMDLDKLQEDIECDRFSLTKWSPMATEINRDEFLGLSFSHHMEILHKTKKIDEVLLCIHEAVVHQWDKYTLRNILKAGIPRILRAYGEYCFKFTDNFIRITLPISNHDHAFLTNVIAKIKNTASQQRVSL